MRTRKNTLLFYIWKKPDVFFPVQGRILFNVKPTIWIVNIKKMEIMGLDLGFKRKKTLSNSIKFKHFLNPIILPFPFSISAPPSWHKSKYNPSSRPYVKGVIYSGTKFKLKPRRELNQSIACPSWYHSQIAF